MKTSELTGAALDWAVAECEGHDFPAADAFCGIFNPSTDWAQGGPIIERELIDIRHIRSTTMYWEAWTPAPEQEDGETSAVGPNPLIAAMRCYVASKLGAEVDVPKELL